MSVAEQEEVQTEINQTLDLIQETLSLLEIQFGQGK
jgi:hypothetical protein